MLKKTVPYRIANESVNWFSFFGELHRHTALRKLLLNIFLIGLYTWAFVYIQTEVIQNDQKISPTVHQILGITLGLLLVIRTNTAYDRFWEGRRLIGGLVNNCRNLALNLAIFIPENEKGIREKFAGLISAYCYALKNHLRLEDYMSERMDFTEIEVVSEDAAIAARNYVHSPNGIMNVMYQNLLYLKQSGTIKAEDLIVLDNLFEEYTNIIGGCERIKNTPLPFAYRIHLKFFIFIYIMTLPFGIYHELHYWCIPAVMLIFYAMVGLELIGEEIEDPFGTDANDIPMDSICFKIRHNVYEILSPENAEHVKKF